MLELILSTEFTAGLLAILAGVCLMGILRLRRASVLFEAMLVEFTKWHPQEQDGEAFASYRASVEEFAARTSSKACGVWALFLADVELKPAGEHPGRAECTADGLDKLRDNLLFAYATSSRLSRLSGQALAGLGFMGTLGIVAAAAVVAEPYFNTPTGMAQAVSILVSGGGLAFISSIVGILSSLAFNAFERSEMAKVEETIDDFLAEIRNRVDCKTDRHYLAGIGKALHRNSHDFSVFARDISDRVMRLTEVQVSREALIEANERLTEGVTLAIDKGAEKINEGVALAFQKALESTRDLQQQQLGALTRLVDHSQTSLAWRDALLEQIRAQAATAVDQLDVTTHLVSQIETYHDEERARHDELKAEHKHAKEHRKKLEDLISGITESIEDLDEGIEDDFDHLVSQSRETQTALMHYLSDNIENHLTALKGEMETLGALRHQDHQQSMASIDAAKDDLTASFESLQKILETSNENGGANFAELKAALHDSVEQVREAFLQTANQQSSSYSEMTKLLGDMHTEQKESNFRAAKSRTKAILEKLSRAEDKAASRGDDELPSACTADQSATSRDQEIDPTSLPEILHWMRRTRSSTEHALRNLSVIGEQSSHLAKSCQTAIRDMNTMNESLLDQTEQRLTRYGKAYQPLAESNLMICDFLTRAIKDAGEFKRQGLFSYKPFIEALESAHERLLQLESLAHEIGEGQPKASRQLQKLEQLWRQDSHLAVVEQISEELRQDAASDGRMHLQSQHVVGQLKVEVEKLQAVIDASILDQVSNWPVILDQARQLWDSAKQLASFEGRFGKSQSRNEERFHEALTQLESILEQSEHVLGLERSKKRSS